MADYTLIVNEEQKAIIVKALEAFSQLYVGQTHIEKLTARKLVSPIVKFQGTTIDLAKIIP